MLLHLPLSFHAKKRVPFNFVFFFQNNPRVANNLKYHPHTTHTITHSITHSIIQKSNKPHMTMMWRSCCYNKVAEWCVGEWKKIGRHVSGHFSNGIKHWGCDWHWSTYRKILRNTHTLTHKLLHILSSFCIFSWDKEDVVDFFFYFVIVLWHCLLFHFEWKCSGECERRHDTFIRSWNSKDSNKCVECVGSSCCSWNFLSQSL